jgi:hypothetical protein
MPEEIRDGIRDRLWAKAEDLGWSSLSDGERARYYELWTNDPAIGGQLAHFMDARRVRVYIKDSLIKPYERTRLSQSEAEMWRLVGLTPPQRVSETFIKPHGRRLVDGKIVCWGKSRDWKLVLMAAFERAQASSEYDSYGVVLIETGKTGRDAQRRVVREAARRLGIRNLAWAE